MAKSSEPAKLKQITDALKEECNPSRKFLFGSGANGTARVDNDYDFLVAVKKATKSRTENMLRASKALEHAEAQVDVFVFSEKEFDEWKNELSPIPETAVNTGQEIELG